MTVLTVDTTTSVGTFQVRARLRAEPGVTALFGPSGSGKSVTLATIAGLLRPEAGRVAFDDQVVAAAEDGFHLPTQERRIGMVFQHAALWPHRSPIDNVALAVRGPADRRARREHAQLWLDRVQAGELLDAPTATLSGGEQQRVALARALAGEPRVLLLDEPFSALDQPTRIALRTLVAELVDDQGITALLVTHDLDDVTALADQLVRFEPGRTIGSHPLRRGHPDELAHVLGLE